MGFRDQDVKEANDPDHALQGYDDIDPDHGPLAMGERGCTDCFCCLIYIAFVIACIGITAYGYAIGKPERLMASYDNNGFQCGGTYLKSGSAAGPEQETLGYENYKYKHFPYMTPQYLASSAALTDDNAQWKVGVCVKKCPSKGDVLKPGTDYIKVVNGSSTSYWTVNKDLSGTTFAYQQLGGYCIPTWDSLGAVAKDLYAVMDTKTGGAMTRYMVDLAESWQVLLGMAFGSLFITIIYVVLLRCITKILLFVSIIGLMLCGFAFTGWNVYKYVQLCTGANAVCPDEGNTALYIGIIAGVVTLLYMICICCLWEAIQLGTAIMEACSDFLSSTTRLGFVPLFTYFITIPVIVWWLIGSVFIYGTGEVTYTPGQAFPASTMGTKETAMFWVLLFGILWMLIWFAAFQNFVIAATACQWYFFGQGSDIEDVKDDVKITLSAGWAFKYHMGTLAFGSFLVTVCTIIKFIFEYFAHQAEKLSGDNTCVQILICLARCCVYCVDCCVRFMSDNAYIQTAIRGTSFCESAVNCFYMMVRNPAAYSALNYISWIMMLLGKGLIVSLSAYLTYILTQYALPNIQQPLVPAIANGIWAFLVSSLYLGIFDFSAMAILQCFLVNHEVGGKRNTPESLKPFIDQLEDDEVKRNPEYQKKYNGAAKAGENKTDGPQAQPTKVE